MMPALSCRMWVRRASLNLCDRDAHPCQLPEKLMERLIRLTTRPGDLVFDPFCGAGTTAIAARKLGRDFVVVDLDADYVRLTREKLVAMARGQAASGVAAVPRARVARPRKAFPNATLNWRCNSSPATWGARPRSGSQPRAFAADRARYRIPPRPETRPDRVVP